MSDEQRYPNEVFLASPSPKPCFYLLQKVQNILLKETWTLPLRQPSDPVAQGNSYYYRRQKYTLRQTQMIFQRFLSRVVDPRYSHWQSRINQGHAYPKRILPHEQMLGNQLSHKL